MRKTIAAALVAVATLAVAGPAEAVWVRPRTAPLLNVAGEASGCTVTAKGSSFVRDGVRRLSHKAEVTCDRSWGRGTATLNAYLIAADGSRTVLYAGGGASWSPVSPGRHGGGSVVPVCAQGWPFPDVDWVAGQTYEVVLASIGKVKATPNWTGEPYVGRGEKLVTFTC